VDREEAQRALAVLRRVVDQAKDDTALQNWGLIWIVQGFLNGAGFIATHVLLGKGYEDPLPFVILWTVIIGGDLLARLLLRRGRAGVRSFVETQMFAIWTAFIGAVSLVAVLNHAMGLRTFFLGPVIGALMAMAFAIMASQVGWRWLVVAGVFAVTSVVMALLPHVQFIILGVVWGVAQFGTGVLLDRARRRNVAGTQLT
jgi:hypothetical protein